MKRKLLIPLIFIGLAIAVIVLTLIANTLFLNILSLVLLLINGALFAFSKEIAAESPTVSWVDKLKFKIPATIFVIAMLYGIDHKKENINSASSKREQHYRDSTAEHKQNVRDSIAERKQNIRDSEHEAIEKSYFLQQSEVLAKYGLKYDSATRTIAKLVSDSMRSLPDPEIGLCNYGIRLDSIKNNISFFRISLCDTKAPASNINIKFYFVVEIDGEFYLIMNMSDYPFLSPNSQMRTDEESNSGFRISYDNAKKVYCFIKGTYTDFRGIKKYKINSLYMYSYWNKHFSGLNNEFEQKVRKFLEEKGIN